MRTVNQIHVRLMRVNFITSKVRVKACSEIQEACNFKLTFEVCLLFTYETVFKQQLIEHILRTASILKVIEKYKQTWYLCNYFFLIVNVPPNKVDENEQVDDIKYFLLAMLPYQYNIILFEEGEFCTNSLISTNFLRKKNSLCSHLEPVISSKSTPRKNKLNKSKILRNILFSFDIQFFIWMEPKLLGPSTQIFRSAIVLQLIHRRFD